MRLRHLSFLLLLFTPAAEAQIGRHELLLSLWDGDPDVAIVEPDGTILQTFVSSSSAGLCQGAALTANGEVLTGRWQPSGGFTLFGLGGGEAEFTLPGPGFIGDTAVLAGGELLVADQDGVVEVFAADGSHLFSMGAGVLDHPWGLYVDADNTVWVGDLGDGFDVHRFQADGTWLVSLELGVSPGDLVRAWDGTLWLIDETTAIVHQFATDGTPLFSFPTPLGKEAAGLAFEADGTIVVSDWNSSALFRYSQTGTYLGLTDLLFSGGVLGISRPGASPLGTAYCGPANPSSSGFPGQMSAEGSLDVADDDLTLVATRLPANKLCYLINGLTRTFVPNPGGSQGNLCIQGAGRHRAQAGLTDVGGTYSVPIDLTAVPRPGGGAVAVQPGETWYWQAWFRDVNPGQTSNFTDGIAITFQ